MTSGRQEVLTDSSSHEPIRRFQVYRVIGLMFCSAACVRQEHDDAPIQETKKNGMVGCLWRSNNSNKFNTVSANTTWAFCAIHDGTDCYF